jgi:DNA-binding transcriptional MerR regulator
MRIGELAQQAETSTKAIRYYEQIGVMPEPDRTASGYRDYTDEATDRLSFIHSAQKAGLTLSEIRGVIDVRASGDTPCEHVIDLIDTKLEDLDTRIAALQHTKHELTRLRSRSTQLDPNQCQPGTVCQIIYPNS